jgi:hypothetical protein
MKLMELLHTMDAENKDGLVNVDDWRWPDVDHLITMGFEFGDDHHLQTNKEPRITIYKKKEKDKDGKKTQYFYVEEQGREKKRFKNFNDVIDYFDTYSQPELDKNM